MDLHLFQELGPAERMEMLDAQADEVLEENYLRPYENAELQKARQEYVNLSLQMTEIKAEEDEIKQQFKERKAPVQKEMDRVLGNIKQGGEYVKGKLYKIIDRDERVTGFYDEDGKLINQRKSLPNELQGTLFTTIRMNAKTGTNE
ncbi:MAG: hypothetical protein ACI3ZD_10720 [Prevotella sp.]